MKKVVIYFEEERGVVVKISLAKNGKGVLNSGHIPKGGKSCGEIRGEE